MIGSNPIDLDAVSWDDLRLFTIAARHRSFRRAGLDAKISASTFARRIEILEEQLGLKLFNRMPDGIVLTAQGERIFEAVVEMRSPLQNLKAVIEEERVGASSVSMNVTQGMGVGWVIPRAAEFQAEHPDIRLDIRLSADLADVLRFGCQIAIQLRRPENADVIAYRLGRMHFQLFASSGYIERFGKPESWEDVGRHRFVDQIDSVVSNVQVEDILQGSQAAGRIATRVNSSLANLAAVEAGLGIGVLPTYCIAFFGSKIEPIDIGLRTRNLDIWLTFRPEVRASRSAGAVIDWIKSIYDTRKYPWFNDEFIHPAEFTEPRL
ncbi:LysR family transcriptional regulator [Bosea caraganae]|uniref:LysR family transcriptional regulator n=1 Tax=Bosea caraganae TaxID=2763117 RepID=A0A370L093_9HYPH|nr:LysR family transcriptional regulator [Bosea caraganae]RDJ20272.1 LysR family transcriptional regulator [Bosea caraganae]RDJ23969.1 LysR family transcriptional regulator [Bosea caraganae]